PWIVPLEVTIFDDSLSVMLLLISLPFTPRRSPLSLSQASIRSASFFSFSICFSRWERLSGGGESSSSFRSSSSCSVSSSFTFSSSFSRFARNSDTVLLHCGDALHDSLHPSNAKSVPPSSFISSQTSSTSRNSGRISSFMELTNVEIVLWSGYCLQESAMNTTFSWHACSIFLDEVSPREYPSNTTFNSILGSYARRPVSSLQYFSSNRLTSIRSSTSVWIAYSRLPGMICSCND